MYQVWIVCMLTHCKGNKTKFKTLWSVQSFGLWCCVVWCSGTKLLNLASRGIFLRSIGPWLSIHTASHPRRFYFLYCWLWDIKSLFSFYERSQNCEKRQLYSLCPFVLPFAWSNSAPNWTILNKFWIWVFLEHKSNLKYHWNLTRTTSTSHEHQGTFPTSRLIFL